MWPWSICAFPISEIDGASESVAGRRAPTTPRIPSRQRKRDVGTSSVCFGWLLFFLSAGIDSNVAQTFYSNVYNEKINKRKFDRYRHFVIPLENLEIYTTREFSILLDWENVLTIIYR